MAAIEEVPPATAPLAPEVFNPDAAASWNAMATLGAAPPDTGSDEPVEVEQPAAAPAPLAPGVIEVHDPVRAAAWRAAMAGHVADVPGRPVVVTAVPDPDPLPDEPPVLDEWGGQTGPSLGEEFLALIGNAARQASLDAFDALDETSKPEPQPERRERPRSRPRPAGRAARTASARKARPKKPRPPQDEWGMFDPSQCGSEALFDEEAWDEDPDDVRPSSRGR
jgi:hypothetical protein